MRLTFCVSSVMTADLSERGPVKRLDDPLNFFTIFQNDLLQFEFCNSFFQKFALVSPIIFVQVFLIFLYSLHSFEFLFKDNNLAFLKELLSVVQFFPDVSMHPWLIFCPHLDFSWLGVF